MVEALAFRIAKSIKDVDPKNTASIEVMKFALVVLIDGFLVFSISLIISIILNQTVLTMLGLFSFVILRYITGGYHFKSALACSITSIIMVVLIPFISITGWMYELFAGLSILLILIFAPANLEGRTRIPKKFYPYLKLTAIVLVVSSYIIKSDPITLAFLIQSITLIGRRV
ncbi:accessory gene regulator B family protein [Chengkuizengella sediminis]|uniref:accessory gene regulator B family protein n=1 Tax=Chengkuizengella sediminis TaxID=1885917 RepID=UPI0013898DCA|nr:accessory gene regulator B family protein [Chengkuizengella sediminis]NDI36773.1 hypothetical protein [Chengkuizengella sediminis]